MKASRYSAADAARRARERGLLAVLDGPLRPGLIRAAGPDAPAFLQGQLTSDVAGLAPGEGGESARLTRKGQLLDLLSVHALGDTPEPHILMLCDGDRAAALRDDLDAFHFAENLTLDDRTGRHDWLLLLGPEAAAVMESTFGPAPDSEHWISLPPNSIRSLAGGEPEDRTLVFARGDGLLVAAPREAALLPRLVGMLQPEAEARGMTVEPDDLAEILEILRIEDGLPRAGFDFEPGKRLLTDTGLELKVASTTKGCYLGQEIVARVSSRGSASRVLRGLLLDQGVEAAAPGSDLIVEGKTIGSWASSTESPTLGAPVALAYLDRDHRTPGQGLALDTGSAEVTLLPFVRAADTALRADGLYDEAVRRFADGEDDRALALLERALALDPAHADSWEAVGVILGRSGRFAEAIDTFRRLEEVSPDEPMVHTNLSLYYMKLGDLESAERHRAQATMTRFGAMAGEAAAAEQERAEAERLRADAERRLAMFTEVLEIDTDDPLALTGAGKALLELDRHAEAEPILARACAAQADNSPVYALHGRVLERLGRADEAAAVYRRGIEAAARKGDLMPLREMENRLLLLAGC